MPFVEVKKGHHQSQSIESTRPEVIIHGKSKMIRINHAAYALLGSPRRVRVAWDAEEKLLGIKAASATDPDSFAVTVTKTQSYIIHSASVIYLTGLGRNSSGYLTAEMKGDYLAVSPFKKPEGIFAEIFTPLEDASA
jgi:hypothetical protein